MNVRPPTIGILLATAMLAFATPVPAATSVVCENVTTYALHVGVAVDTHDPCYQGCPSMVNVNVAVAVSGQIRQCSNLDLDEAGIPNLEIPRLR